jgi:two-component system, chemotaxis family, chemotaxis protein CheY
VKRVLLVDDSNSIRAQVAAALEQAEFEVFGVADGPAALAQLAGPDAFDLVVLDVNLPGMSGLEILDRLMAEPATREIPVLMLTTGSDREQLERARKAGAKGWLVKPFNSALLVSTARRFTLERAPS